MLIRALLGTLTGTFTAAIGLLLAFVCGESLPSTDPATILVQLAFFFPFVWAGMIICAGPGAFLFSLPLGAMVERLRPIRAGWVMTVPIGILLGLVNLTIVGAVLPIEINGYWIVAALLGGAGGGLGLAVTERLHTREEVPDAILWIDEGAVQATPRFFETVRQARWRKSMGEEARILRIEL